MAEDFDHSRLLTSSFHVGLCNATAANLYLISALLQGVTSLALVQRMYNRPSTRVECVMFIQHSFVKGVSLISPQNLFDRPSVSRCCRRLALVLFLVLNILTVVILER